MTMLAGSVVGRGQDFGACFLTGDKDSVSETNIVWKTLATCIISPEKLYTVTKETRGLDKDQAQSRRKTEHGRLKVKPWPGWSQGRGPQGGLRWLCSRHLQGRLGRRLQRDRDCDWLTWGGGHKHDGRLTFSCPSLQGRARQGSRQTSSGGNPGGSVLLEPEACVEGKNGEGCGFHPTGSEKLLKAGELRQHGVCS